MDVLSGLSLPTDPRLLVGIEGADDAGVFQLDAERALVQTLDFFTPVVDDPYLFGQIAAANAFSDVYSMGGEPLTAMNIVAFPIQELDHAVLRDILAGGIDKIAEAGAVLAGGHSIDDPEVKYGLSVTGLVHPERIWTNTGARDQDVLLLTKALGSGVLATALKADFCSREEMEAATQVMARLNKLPGETTAPGWRERVHACTDVTGFGLLGHLGEMVADGQVGVVLELSGIPFLPGAEQYCSMGLFPEGGARNRNFFSCRVTRRREFSDVVFDLLFDPQTSGGLLLAVDPDGADAVCRAFAAAGQDCRQIGRFSAEISGRIEIM